MKELVQNSDKISIFTLGLGRTIFDSKPRIFNVLTDVVIPHLAADENLTKQRKETYDRLKNVVQIALNSSYTVVTDLATYAMAWYSNQSKVVAGKSGMFGVVDSHLNLKPFRHMLALFGKYKPSRPHNVMDFCRFKMVCFVQNKLFAKLFASGLTSLVESGIYHWWYENGNIQKPLFDVLWLFEKEIHKAI